jgi:hypothetical protein
MNLCEDQNYPFRFRVDAPKLFKILMIIKVMDKTNNFYKIEINI